jgi:hypothetical protein
MRRDQPRPPDDVGHHRNEIGGAVGTHRVPVDGRDVSPGRVDTDPTPGYYTDLADTRFHNDVSTARTQNPSTSKRTSKTMGSSVIG